MIITWIGFLLSVGLIIGLARKNLWMGLMAGALLLGIFNLSFIKIASVAGSTLSDISIVLLAISVGLIPLIGGIMEESHLMEGLVNNLRIGKKGFLMLSPALFGMLPMPGGALLSAPMVERGGEGVSGAQKAALNVWFRHLLIFMYPLGALLPTTKMAGLNLYRELLYLLPYFIVLTVTGYIFTIRGIKGNINYRGRFNLKKLLVPLAVILLAPIIHSLLMRIFNIVEIGLLIGVSASLIVAWVTSGLKRKDFLRIAKKMQPWNYTLIIFGMFLFLNIFKAAEMSEVIAAIAFSPVFLVIFIGALLGFATGRVQVPVSIILPIFYAKYGESAMTFPVFAVMFFGIFIGYLISPIHPCVSVSVEYFNTNLKDYMKFVIPPAVISIIIATAAAFLVFAG